MFKGERFGVDFYKGKAKPEALTARQYDWFTSRGYVVEGDRPEEAESPKATAKAESPKAKESNKQQD